MPFDIREHINSLELIREISTEWTVVCPCCQGKLKISKRKGAYLCVTDGCKSKEIRSFLSPIKSNGEYRPPEPLITPVNLKRGCQLLEIDYQLRVTVEKYWSDKSHQTITKTTYGYDDLHKTVRYDFVNEKGKNDKVIIPYTFDSQLKRWEKKGDSLSFPFFNERLLTHLNEDCVVLIAEGEKCCDFIGTNLNYLAISPTGLGWSQDWLKENILRIWLRYKFAGFLFLPDNDLSGQRKARRFQKTCWMMGIGCAIADLSAYYRFNGDDVVDLYERGMDAVEMKKVLLSCLNQ